jgi:dTDP-4-dehydrorhamnose 3,5-epimerase
MKVTALKIPDVKLIEPEIFEDERGYFFESFNQNEFNKTIGSNINFVQDNQSKSSKGVLRGFHLQIEPFSQGKLVRVVSGEIFDVVVDVRKDSKTFSNWLGIYLNDIDQKQLWVPNGFAHGFMAMSNETSILYKVTNYYSKEHEVTIFYDDDDLSIEWPSNIPKKISEKDKNGISLKDFLLK